MSQDLQGMSLLASPVRRAIFETLSNLPRETSVPGARIRSLGLTAAELGERLGLHLTTVCSHVDQLVKGGFLVARDVREGVGRPRRRYAASPGNIAGVPRLDSYKILAELLADTMVDEHAQGVLISAEDAAARWVQRHAAEIVPDHISAAPATTPGQFLAKIGALIDLLERWGYESTVRTSEGGRTVEIDLTHCPLRELALRNPNVACGIHGGLVRATMAALGESDANIGLTPFVEPALCRARVTTLRDLAVQKEEKS